MKDIDFYKICRDVLDALKSENPQNSVEIKKSNLSNAITPTLIKVF